MRSALRGLLNVLGPAVIEVVDDVRDVGDFFRFAPSRRSLLNRHLMLSRMMVTGLVRR